MEWIVQLPILFFSVMIHELFHGWTAYLKGDKTAEKAGRLTLNPIPHIDPFGTFFLPVLCYVSHAPMLGWAKPVPVNISKLKNARKDMIAVAFMGPAANLILAAACAVLYRLTAMAPGSPDFQKTIMNALIYAVNINLVLAFFNLIPVHPLDGSQVLSSLLPPQWRARYERHAPYGLAIILALMVTPAVNILVFIPSQKVYAFLSYIGLLTA